MLLWAGACSSPEAQNKEPRPATPDFYKEMRSVSKINFASMDVTKTITTERTKWYKIGKRIGVYSYNAYLKAYIDLEELRPQDVRVDTLRKVVELTLPPVHVEVTGRSPELRKEYEHIDLFRTHPDSRERAALKEMANDDFMREVRENPEFTDRLTAQARKKAVSYFNALVEARGYTAVVK